jgi:hypothetical protein
MEAHSQGNKVVLVFKDDIGTALRQMCDLDADSDAVHLARAAKIVRKDILKTKLKFNGSFDARCQEQSVPASLVALVSVVLHGPNIKSQSSTTTTSQPALTLSQLLVYNSSKRCGNNSAGIVRHSKERETPLPIYLGTMIHSKTRKRELVDILFSLGLCISYDRILDISTELGNKICHYYEHENAVCPPNLKSGVFTTAAVNNIDHNPSSIGAHDSFHETGISLFQHPDDNNTGVIREVILRQQYSHTKKTRLKLPEFYTVVPPIAFSKLDPPVPKLEGPNRGQCELIAEAIEKEYR